MLHVDPFSVADFRRLDQVRGDCCVSIYLPTHTVSRETDQDKILFKNLVRTAIDQLEAAKTDKRRVSMLADQLKGLDDKLDFWNHMAQGLAAFATPVSLEVFRLPREVYEVVEVSDRFHLKPLIPLLAFPHTAYVLEISQNRVQLWEVSESEMSIVDVPDLPTSFDAAMEQRTGRPTADAESVDMRRDEQRQVRQRQFTRSIAQAVEPYLRGSHAPLILAGVETMLVYYCEANTYANTAETMITGNQENRRRDEFAAEARAIVAHRFEAEICGYLDRVDDLRGKRLSSKDLNEITQAALEGRIESLIVDVERPSYGRVSGGADPIAGAQASSSTYDILDELVSLTVRNGGRVIGLREDQMPDGVKAAAIFRYTHE